MGGSEAMSLCGISGCPVFKPVLIRTEPGAQQQKYHTDTDREHTYSILVAVTSRDFIFRNAGTIHLSRGDVLIFKSTLCHSGAPLASDAPPSLGLHMYAGTGITKVHLEHTWICLDDAPKPAPRPKHTLPIPESLEASPRALPMSAGLKRMQTEAELGWLVCGCNGCMLLEFHAGPCVFLELPSSKRS